MSCGCNQDPCGCQAVSVSDDPCDNICLEDKVNPDWPATSLCTGDRTNNIWFKPGPPGFQGQCKLDTMTYDQVIAVLERVPCAKRDLLRITNDVCLVRLANEVKLVEPVQESNQRVQDRLNRNSLPYYTVFRGNTGGDPGH